MGLLPFSINVSLDGCVDHQEGIADEETHAFFTRLMDEHGAMLWGRVTYEMMEGHWPAVLVFYAAVCIAYALDPDDQGNRFAFGATWIMTFAVYLAILAAGVALSFVPKPTHLVSRYILGLLPPALLYVVL